MNWLIWKEYRLNRLIVIVGLLLLIGPHAAVAFLLWWHHYLPENRPFMFVLAFYSLILSQVTIALIAGNAIACERADRSAEFLAYLPVSRGRTLAAKLMLASAFIVTIWVSNLLIMATVDLGPLNMPSDAVDAIWGALWNTAITGAVFFGVGWGLSSILQSPTFSICGGLFAPAIVVGGIMWLRYLLGYPGPDSHDFDPHQFTLWYRVPCALLALTSFVAGTVYYLRRVEP